MEKEYYSAGHRNGYFDRFLLDEPLQTALTSSLPGYAKGYRDGWNHAGEKVKAD